MAEFNEGQERRAEWEIPSGVFVVSLKSGQHANAYAAGWVVRVSEVPVMIQVAVWDQNYSFGLAQDCTHFAVHVLEDGQQAVARHFGRTSGRDIDKFVGRAWHAGISGVPILEDCLAFLECQVDFRRRFGDHMILAGPSIQSGINRPGRALIYNYQDYQ